MCTLSESFSIMCILTVLHMSHEATDILDPNTAVTETVKTNTSWPISCPQNCSCFKALPISVPAKDATTSIIRKTVNCSRVAMDIPPRGIPADTEFLYLSDSGFNTLRKLPNTPGLLYLEVTNCSVEAIDSFYLFAQYKKLKYLILKENKLRELPAGKFSGLSSLYYLDLSSNLLENISVNAFAGLSHLKSLNLHDNQLMHIDYMWFEDIYTLRELDLSNNLLTFVDAKDLYILHDLNLLNLSYNQIRSIDSSAFNFLQNLLILDMSNNSLSFIPTKPLQAAIKLKKVTFDGNPIVKIESKDIADIKVSRLSISYMDKLSIIEKNSFHNLPNLVDVHAHNNPKLIYIDGHAFSNVPKLRTLYLYNNQLTALSPNIVASVPDLFEIHLYHNPLRCDCNAFWVREIIEESKVQNYSKPFFNHSDFIKCDYPLNLTGVPISDIDTEQFDRVCVPTTLPSFKENYTLDLGEELRLECHTYGVPEPILSWLLPNGSEITSNVHGDKFEIIDNCILIIRHLKVNDSGTYGCKASNGVGFDISSTRITVSNKPVRLIPFTVSNDYISISWNGTKHRSMISDYQLTYREINGWDIKVIRLDHYHSYTVTNLKPRTFYEFCIVYVYDREEYKVDCVTIKTKLNTKHRSAIKKIISEKIIAGVCTAMGLILAIACMVTVVKKFRFKKEYDTTYDADESETINIPMENMYQPLNTIGCSSKTSLLSSGTQRCALEDY